MLTHHEDGKPPHDRSWKECFGQLRGTVLSMWDAAALDDAEYTGAEVVPTFLNLADASIKMVKCERALEPIVC